MATNRVFEDGRELSVVCSDPTTPTSGAPVRCGGLTGVALTDERSDGTTSVDLGPSVYDLSVKGVDDAGNAAVAVGDAIFYVDADTPKLSKKVSGYFFGFALEVVSSGATTTVQVLVLPSPGPGTADILASTIGTSELVDDAVTAAKIADGAIDAAAKFAAGVVDAAAIAANAVGSSELADDAVDTAAIAADAVTGAKIAPGFMDVYSVAGNDETMDATYTVTGVAVGDAIIAVLHLSTLAAVATVDVLTPGDFTVTGADEITAGNPADRTNDQLIFFVLDQT